MAVTGEGKDRNGATIRKPLLMPRDIDIPAWVVVPGWQEPAAERRQAAATDNSMASGHPRSRGKEGARPGPGLTRAERGNVPRVRIPGAGMRRRCGKPTVRRAELPGRTGYPGKQMPGGRKAAGKRDRRIGNSSRRVLVLTGGTMRMYQKLVIRQKCVCSEFRFCRTGAIRHGYVMRWSPSGRPGSSPGPTGFRPGRGCHDAIESLYNTLHGKSRRAWILDADLAGAFDKISHGHLLEMLGGFPARGMIAGWLKAGIFEAGKGSRRPERELLRTALFHPCAEYRITRAGGGRRRPLPDRCSCRVCEGWLSGAH
jgi:hypothetical protein